MRDKNAIKILIKKIYFIFFGLFLQEKIYSILKLRNN